MGQIAKIKECKPLNSVDWLIGVELVEAFLDDWFI
jgi:hypothetical protein